MKSNFETLWLNQLFTSIENWIAAQYSCSFLLTILAQIYASKFYRGDNIQSRFYKSILMITEHRVVTVQEAGRRGGLKIRAKFGRSFFSDIGKKGQKAMRDKYPGKASEWGKMGGRPVKPPLGEDGEVGKSQKRRRRTRP
jgi:hypothetical protein